MNPFMTEESPPSVGPTAASPYATASTLGGLGGPPILELPEGWSGKPSAPARRPSSDLIVYQNESGKPSVERPTNVDLSSSDESDAEEWLADPAGGFVPSPSKRHGTWTPAAMLNQHFAASWHRQVGGSGAPRSSRTRPTARKNAHTLLLLAAILLGPNLALLAYLCGAGAPSGSAAKPAAPAHAPWEDEPEPLGEDVLFPSLAPLLSGLPMWRGGAPLREREPTGSGFWLLPAVLWKRGVVLIPQMVG